MNPSYQLMLGNLHAGMSDKEFFEHEMRIAELAEPLGYSSIWCVEHHFDTTYSVCPDNLQILTYLAGRTKNIGLTTGAIILPWHKDPLRIAERISMLDLLSNGRLSIGIGRGLSKIEYNGFGVDMEDSRERWSEALGIIRSALNDGYAESDGKHFKQARVPLTPHSGIPADGRLIEIAMSAESVTLAAELGARMATFLQFAIGKHKSLFDLYKEKYEAAHQRPAPPPVITEFVHCAEDPEEARRMQYQGAGRYFAELMRHYDFAGEHFAKTKTYESYDEIAAAFREAGMEAAAEGYIQTNTFGTPDEIIEKIRERRATIGDYDLNVVMSYGGIPYDKVESSMRLFAENVMPEWRKMKEATLEPANA